MSLITSDLNSIKQDKSAEFKNNEAVGGLRGYFLLLKRSHCSLAFPKNMKNKLQSKGKAMHLTKKTVANGTSKVIHILVHNIYFPA